MDKSYIFICFMCVVLGGLITNIFLESEERDDLINNIDDGYNTLKAYREKTGTNFNGIYFPSETFCIHLTDRNREEIEKTIHHEYLHDLIMKNRTYRNESAYEHFCG